MINRRQFCPLFEHFNPFDPKRHFPVGRALRPNCNKKTALTLHRSIWELTQGETGKIYTHQIYPVTPQRVCSEDQTQA